MASLARACSAQTSAGFSPVSGGTAGLVADAADEAWWTSKYPNWDDAAAGCCAGGVVGAEGGAETRAGGVDGLDAGAEGAGAASEAGAGWVSGTESSSGSSVNTDGASSVGSLTTRVGMGWEGGGAGTSSGADGAGVGPRADSVPSAEMTSPESGDGPFGGAGVGSGDKAAASRMGDSGIGLGVDIAG